MDSMLLVAGDNESNNSGSLNKDRIAEILDQRNKKRQINLDTVHELKNKEASETEGRDYFDQTFESKTREIKNNLNNLQEGGDKNELLQSFNVIVQSIQEVQRYLSTSTLFLTDYKIKTCQNVINEMHLRCDELRQKLLPKKKFGFKTKRPVVAGTPSSPGAAESGQLVAAVALPVTAFEWSVAKRQNELISLVQSQDVAVNGQDLTLCDLDNCVVQIVGHPGSIQMSRLRNCLLVTGPVARSIFADHCTNCTFAFACQQMRLHSSSDCDIYLHVTCRGIIEDSQRIRFAAYNYHYAGQEDDFKLANLCPVANNWHDVADFNWLSPDLPSPNWERLPPGEMVNDWPRKIDKFKCDFKLTG